MLFCLSEHEVYIGINERGLKSELTKFMITRSRYLQKFFGCLGQEGYSL